MFTRKFWGLLLLGLICLTACTPAALPSFDTSNIVAEAQATAEIALQATATARLEAQATQTTAQTVAEIPAVLSSADVTNGELLFTTFQATAGFACSTCHWVDTENQLIGPGLLNIRTRAEIRVEGQNAVDYVFTSIVNPDAYVVDGFSADLMPENWSEIYSDEQIYDIIAYLWTLNSE